MSTFTKRLIVFALIAGMLLTAFFFTPLGDLIDFQKIFENRRDLLETVRESYAPAVFVYMGVYVLVTALSIPGAGVLTMLGGFFFGPWLAVLYINAGATLGAFFIFLAARFFLGEGIQKKYGEKLTKFNRELETNGKNYMLILRLVPVFPFFLVNLFAGLTTISPLTFLWTTSLGIIPGSFAYAWLGHAGAVVGEGAPWQLLTALGLLSLLSLIPVILRKIKNKQRTA